MKKLISFFALLSLSFSLWAQVDREKGTLGLQAFEGNAALIMKDGMLRIQKGDKVDSVGFQKQDKAFALSKAEDIQKIYSILGINSAQLEQALADQAGANTIDKLLDITSKMKDQKLVLQSSTAHNSDTSLLEEGALPATEVAQTENTSSSWLMPSLIGLGALVIGILLGRATKTKPLPAPAPVQNIPSDNVIESVQPVNNKLVDQLKQELAAAKEKNNLINDKTQKLIEGDGIYYTAIFDKIILPLQTALDNGNESEIAKYINLAMVHLSSITRVKIRKKQNYDDANIQLIIGNASLTSPFPTIDSQTPIDKIPANLRVLIQFLQKNGVKGLEDTIIKGYKLKDL